MNKISKKIVALATMAAFVLTLVPAAAFGAPSATNSRIEVDGSQTVTDVVAGDTVTVDFVINEEGTGNGIASTDPIDAEKLKVWVTDKAGNYVDTVEYVQNNGSPAPCTNNSNIYKFTRPVYNGNSFALKFTAGGEYEIHAGIGDIAETGAFGSGFLNFSGYVNVTVADPETTVDSIDMVGTDGQNISVSKSDPMTDLDLTNSTVWDQNGTAKYTITGTAKVDGNPAPEGKEVTIISGDAGNLQFANKTGEMTTATNNKGEFSFTFTMNDKRNVPVYIEIDGVRYAVNIVTDVTTAYDIDTAEDGGYVLATTDSDHQADRADTFKDAVQFTLTDKAGNVLTGGDVIANEPAHTWNDAKHSQTVSITEQPKKSDLDADELELVAVGDTYTLRYVNGDNANDLYPGKYVVRVALASADYAEATFYVAKFGTVQDLELDMIAKDNSTGREVVLDDQVTLGQKVTVTAKYVDENGLKIKADKVFFGANGKAVIDEDTRVDGATDSLTFYTKLDRADNESLLGTLVTVKAFAANSSANATAELTVVDSYNDMSLEFDPTEGNANEWNDVTVSVVKEDGSVAQVAGKIVAAYVDDQSNEDAIVDVKYDSANVISGKGEISIYSTEDTTADIVVVIQDRSNTNIYSGTLEYTVGAGLGIAHHEVIMTVGASQYVVDKQLFEMDAAPYVDSNWRTMVPLRALMEGFDAEVIWDNDDRTVTINYNEQTIVMTIDEDTYTVNGEEMTMDTEPVIQGDRTYVPIRFAAEAMGFEVTPLYNADNLTASVVFQS